MPGRRYVIGSPDQAQIGIRPDGPQDLAQPGSDQSAPPGRRSTTQASSRYRSAMHVA
jgi:hypothetical protein